MTVSPLRSFFYPIWEQWLLPQSTGSNKRDLLHCTANTAPLFGRMPLLLTIHDLIFLEKNYLVSKEGGSLYQRFGNFYRSIVVPISARKAKHIITVSGYQRNIIISKLKLNPSKVSVVYNGVDSRFFNRADPATKIAILNKHGISFPYIFFMGNTEPRKNTIGAIKAFKIFCEQNPNLTHKFVIKGLTEPQLSEKIKEAGAITFADRIHHIGYIDAADLPAIYQGAEALWFPSFSEGFGLPIIESMASGTPVITSSVSVMPEIAGDAALYVDPYQPRELAIQTKLLLNNPSLKNELIQKGATRAASFTWDRSTTDLMKVYDRMMGEG
jgi:glycosyltransferase involved in cell wall biosynthesis